jgi:hypothetical protein
MIRTLPQASNPYCPNYNGSSNQVGHLTYPSFNWSKPDTKKKKHQMMSLNFSHLITKDYLKSLLVPNKITKSHNHSTKSDKLSNGCHFSK